MNEKILNKDLENFDSNYTNNAGEIELRQIFKILFLGKWKILIIVSIFVFSSLAITYIMPNVYSSEATLYPSEDVQGGGLSGIGGQFSGLANLAGFNIGAGSQVDKSQLAIEVLKSRKFINNFIIKHEILVDLMASEKWEKETNRLIFDSSIYDLEKSAWLIDSEKLVSTQKAYKVFMKSLLIEKDSKTGLITISIESISPFLAKKWLDWIIEDINEVMMRRDVKEAEKSTAYLKELLVKTNVTDIKNVIFKLIEEQMKTIMFAKVRDEYVFKTIDPAVIIEEKVKPRRGYIVLFFSFIGMIVAIFYVLIERYVKESKVNDRQ